jgi:hypothetical protein
MDSTWELLVTSRPTFPTLLNFPIKYFPLCISNQLWQLVHHANGHVLPKPQMSHDSTSPMIPCRFLLGPLAIYIVCVVHYNGLNLNLGLPRHHGCTRCRQSKFFATHLHNHICYNRILEYSWTWIETWWPQLPTHSERFFALKWRNIWIYIPTSSLSTLFFWFTNWNFENLGAFNIPLDRSWKYLSNGVLHAPDIQNCSCKTEKNKSAVV